MRQASAWGQFWFDLSSLYGVHGCGITTPLQTHILPQPWRKPYHSTWYRMPGPVYFHVDGDTMIDMLRDGLVKAGAMSARMKMALLAIAVEDLEKAMERRL